MLGLADHLEEDAELVAFFGLGHLGEGVAVVAEGLVALGGLEAEGVLEDEVAVFGVTAGLVAFETGLRADLGPDFVDEVIVEG